MTDTVRGAVPPSAAAGAVTPNLLAKAHAAASRESFDGAWRSYNLAMRVQPRSPQVTPPEPTTAATASATTTANQAATTTAITAATKITTATTAATTAATASATTTANQAATIAPTATYPVDRSSKLGS